MGFAATMIFYHLIGFGVATAVFLSDSRQGRLVRCSGWRPPSSSGRCTCRSCWPGPRSEADPEIAPSPSDDDAMSHAISQVEAELETALASLDGWVEDVLAHETDRFHELSTAWRAQAERIREMDRVLARTEPAAARADARCLRTGSERPLPPERADSPREPRPASPGSKPGLRGPDGHAGLGP